MSVPLPFCPKCKRPTLVEWDPEGTFKALPELKWCAHCKEYVKPEWGKFNKSKRGAK